MRAALWFLALFGGAVAIALFAGNNEGTVTFFWPPYRLDVSMNLVLFALLGIFLLLHLALRALSLLLSLPSQARSWRARRLERALNRGMLEALAHMRAGRFGRARKSAEDVLAWGTDSTLAGSSKAEVGFLHAMAHLLVAESAHALQDQALRDQHASQASELVTQYAMGELNEGLQLCALRWAIDDRDSNLAQQRISELPSGVARRTLALRLRYKAARLSGQKQQALEVARLLAKHWNFSDEAGRGILRGIALEWIQSVDESDQLKQLWDSLEPIERTSPDIALAAAQRLTQLGGDHQLALKWLLPVWEKQGKSEGSSVEWRERLVQVLEGLFSSAPETPDADWLRRIEAQQQHAPADPLIQFLAGMVCMRLKLWGKAQGLLSQSLGQLKSPELRRKAWRALAEMAEQRSDAEAAADAWRKAAQA